MVNQLPAGSGLQRMILMESALYGFGMNSPNNRCYWLLYALNPFSGNHTF